jgi:hypothetical protein
MERNMIRYIAVNLVAIGTFAAVLFVLEKSEKNKWSVLATNLTELAIISLGIRLVSVDH